MDLYVTRDLTIFPSMKLVPPSDILIIILGHPLLIYKYKLHSILEEVSPWNRMFQMMEETRGGGGVISFIESCLDLVDVGVESVINLWLGK